MTMRVKYINSKGVELPLSGDPYRLYDESLFDFEWDIDMSEKPDGRGSIINAFKKTSKTVDTAIAIHNCSDEEFSNQMNHFFEVIAVDVASKIPGKLMLENGEYIECFIIKAQNKYWNYGRKSNYKGITFLFTQPFWVYPETKIFSPSGGGESTGFLDYNYDYNYDYAFEGKGKSVWKIEHFETSDFEMTIKGFAEDPRIVIGGHPYQVYTTVEEGETLVINSKKKTVVKHLRSGETVNMFDLRAKDFSVFEKIPGGVNVVTWNGAYEFIVTAFLERSEPIW